MDTYYVLPRGTNTMVKGGEFFKTQGGLIEAWGKHWRPVLAASIEEARVIGSKLPSIAPLHFPTLS